MVCVGGCEIVGGGMMDVDMIVMFVVCLFGILVVLFEEFGDLIVVMCVDGVMKMVMFGCCDYYVGIVYGVVCVVMFVWVGKVVVVVMVSVLIYVFGVLGVVFIGVVGGVLCMVWVGDVVVVDMLL